MYEQSESDVETLSLSSCNDTDSSPLVDIEFMMRNCVRNHLNNIHPTNYHDSPKNKKQPKGDTKDANEGIISGL